MVTESEDNKDKRNHLWALRDNPSRVAVGDILGFGSSLPGAKVVGYTEAGKVLACNTGGAARSKCGLCLSRAECPEGKV